MLMPMSIAHYTLHALFKGHFLSSNNIDKTMILIAYIKCRLWNRDSLKKTQILVITDFSIWSENALHLTCINTVAKCTSF